MSQAVDNELMYTAYTIELGLKSQQVVFPAKNIDPNMNLLDLEVDPEDDDQLENLKILEELINTGKFKQHLIE